MKHETVPFRLLANFSSLFNFFRRSSPSMIASTIDNMNNNNNKDNTINNNSAHTEAYSHTRMYHMHKRYRYWRTESIKKSCVRYWLVTGTNWYHRPNTYQVQQYEEQAASRTCLLQRELGSERVSSPPSRPIGLLARSTIMPTMIAVVSMVGHPQKIRGASYKDDMTDRRKPSPQQQ